MILRARNLAHVVVLLLARSFRALHVVETGVEFANFERFVYFVSLGHAVYLIILALKNRFLL